MTNEPDAALLWARAKLAAQWLDMNDEISAAYRIGEMDDHCEELRDMVAGFRAGLAHERAERDALVAALEGLADAYFALCQKTGAPFHEHDGSAYSHARAALASTKGTGND